MNSPGRMYSMLSRDEMENMMDLLLPAMQAEMPSQEREASNEIQAVLLNINRLLWPDMFQSELAQVARILHFDLRPKLQREAKAEVAERVECYTSVLIKVLASWTSRNQLLVIKFGLRLDDMPNTARIGQDEKREIFEAKAKTLPTAEGCKVNHLTAQGFKTYFEEWVTFKFNHEIPLATPEKRIIVCLNSIGDNLNDVAKSAEQLNDASARQTSISEIQTPHVASAQLSTATKPQNALPQSKSTIALHKVQRVFSRASFIVSGDDTCKKGTRNKLRKKPKTTSKPDVPIMQRAKSVNSLPQTSDLDIQPSLRPTLSALPLASLLELEEMQLRIRKTFIHESDTDERVDSPVEQEIANQEHRHEMPQLEHPQALCINPASGIAVRDFGAEEVEAWQKNNNSSEKFATFPSVADLTALERDVIDTGCTTTSPQKLLPASETEEKTEWWHDHAFRELEGMGSQEQDNEEKGGKNDEDDAEGDEGEDEEETKEGNLAARQVDARVLALSVLEGTGPYESGSDFSEGGALKVSCGPD